MPRIQKEPIPPALRWQVWERDNFTCHYCGSRKHLAVDHKIPESRGGPTTLDNLLTACGRCNSRKGSLTYVQFIFRQEANTLVENDREVQVLLYGDRAKLRKRMDRLFQEAYVMCMIRLNPHIFETKAGVDPETGEPTTLIRSKKEWRKARKENPDAIAMFMPSWREIWLGYKGNEEDLLQAEA